MGTYHDDGHNLADLAGARELLLLLLKLGGSLLVAADSLLKVHARLAREVVVVTLADCQHRLPIVVVHAKDEGEDGDEDDGRQERGHIARQHGVVGPGALDVQGAALLLGRDEPGDEGHDEAEDGGETGSPLVLARPDQGQCGGQDGRRDDDAHHDVEIAHRDAGVPQTDRKGRDEESISDNEDVAHVDQALAAGLGVEVGAVEIVREDGAGGDQFRGSGAGDGHEHNQEGGHGTTLAQKSDSGVGKHQARADFGIRHALGVGGEGGIRLERNTGEAHGGGREPRDGKPAEAAEDVTGEGMNGRGRNCLVVIPVIQKYRAKIT